MLKKWLKALLGHSHHSSHYHKHYSSSDHHHYGPRYHSHHHPSQYGHHHYKRNIIAAVSSQASSAADETFV
ncbi:hypothetical protein [Geobacillus thermoleovorans]|uniref:hypothetical protein n=1 Tax=Geobacillus thermoleovorans TaxID=33941 RepID=UPI003F5874DF